MLYKRWCLTLVLILGILIAAPTAIPGFGQDSEVWIEVTNAQNRSVNEVDDNERFFVFVRNPYANESASRQETLSVQILYGDHVLENNLVLEELDMDSEWFQSEALQAISLLQNAPFQVMDNEDFYLQIQYWFTSTQTKGELIQFRLFVNQHITQTGEEIFEPGVHKSMVDIKFREGRNIRLRNGDLVSTGNNDLQAFNELLATQDVAFIERGFDAPEEELEAIVNRFANASGPKLLDYNLFYTIHLNDVTNADAFLEALRQLEIIESASFYYHPLVHTELQAPSLPGTLSTQSVMPQQAGSGTGDFSNQQGYLLPAPNGIDANYAHQQSGGMGEDIRIVDMELSWNLNHEDVDCCFFTAGSRSDNGFAISHGTAVLGVISGQDDGNGITGIAPDARLGVVSWYRGRVEDRIRQAVEQLRPGDVLLLEGQIAINPDGSGCNGSDQSGCFPIEAERTGKNYNPIAEAVLSGIIVVEAAGNSLINLDDPNVYGGSLVPQMSRDAFDFLDSGAIMVGAGHPPNSSAPARSRIQLLNWGSNYGSRVDVQAWGLGVVTAGGNPSPFDDLFNGGNNREYTRSFSGTSSASAIIAGAVASLQGIRKASGQPLYNSLEMRDLLVSTGTPQPAESGHIGPLPDLKAAIEAMDGPQPPSPPPSPTSPLDPLQLIDQNQNGVYEDDEILFAIQLWILGDPFPETEVTINDDVILEAIRLWVLGQGPPPPPVPPSPPPSPTNR